MNSISTWKHGVGVLSQVAVFVCYNGILLDTALLPRAVRLAWSRASPLHLQQNDAASPKKTHKRSKRSKPLAATNYSTSVTNKWHLTRALLLSRMFFIRGRDLAKARTAPHNRTKSCGKEAQTYRLPVGLAVEPTAGYA